jgi:hypothetical protein
MLYPISSHKIRISYQIIAERVAESIMNLQACNKRDSIQ